MLPSRLEIYAVILDLIAALGIGTYFYVGHLQAKVVKLEEKNASLELGQKDLKAKQERFDDFMTTATKTKGRVANVRKQISQEADTVPDAGMDALYDRFRLRRDDKVHSAPPGGKRRPQNAAPGSP